MPDYTLDDFISAFNLTKKGKEFVGPCPVCKDGTDRFYVHEGNAGKVVFGCRHCMSKGDDPTSENAKQVFALLTNGHSNGHAPAAPRPQQSSKPKEPPKPRPLPNREIDTRYDYVDENGKLIFVVIRHDWPDKPKTFSQWIPTEKEGVWLPVAPVGRRPMYRLPDIIKTTGKVAIVEGEKCCLAAKAAWPNQIVTTWSGGTNAWDKTDWTPLVGMDVSLLADGDEPGHNAMRALGLHLHSIGCHVRMALPPLDSKTDVADWIASEGVAGALAEDSRADARLHTRIASTGRNTTNHPAGTGSIHRNGLTGQSALPPAGTIW